MTLKELIRRMEVIASFQPYVKMCVENDVFRLNTYADAKYGVFAFTQGQHTTTMDSSLMSYSFTLFYVDRLTADKSNQIEVQSVGIQVLNNILRSLEEMGVDSDNITFQTFNQRFLDECAGVFANVTFTVPKDSRCADSSYGDYNDDFNEDFYIY